MDPDRKAWISQALSIISIVTYIGPHNSLFQPRYSLQIRGPSYEEVTTAIKSWLLEPYRRDFFIKLYLTWTQSQCEIPKTFNNSKY